MEINGKNLSLAEERKTQKLLTFVRNLDEQKQELGTYLQLRQELVTRVCFFMELAACCFVLETKLKASTQSFFNSQKNRSKLGFMKKGPRTHL